MCLDALQNSFGSSFVNILVGRSISERTLKTDPDYRIHKRGDVNPDSQGGM